MKRMVLGVLLASVASIANASDKVLYQPAPAWVKPSPPIDTAKVDASAPTTIIFDDQQRLADGQVWDYVDVATRIANSQMLTSAGTIAIPWQPSHGDLIIHRLEIVRGAEHIDLVKGGNPFTVLRREERIDQRMLDGVLTATMAVEGLAVGDVLRLTMSTTRKDPTLQGGMQAVAPLISAPARASFARLRLLWPTTQDVRWRAYSDGVSTKPVTVGDLQELSVPLPLPKQSDIPGDAPLRFQHLPILEATSFHDWAGVAKVMRPLYRTAQLIPAGSALKGEVDRIAAAEHDPVKRTAMALQLVQDKVRYLLMGMDTGNYVPQAPAFTWTARYGDCKAKTLLLLAMLDALGVEAVPVLAHTEAGAFVPSRLPGVAAFNHVFVRARIAGEDYWIDPTSTGARLADIRDVPPYGTVLPLDDAAALVRLPVRPDARPTIDVTLVYDDRAGLRLPTLVHAKVAVRGPAAAFLNAGIAQAGESQRQEIVQSVVQPLIGEAQYGDFSTRYDESAGIVTVEATAAITTPWRKQDGRLRQSIDRTVSSIDFKPDRARPAWQAIPAVGNRSDTIAYHVTELLPDAGKGFVLEGDRTVPTSLAGAFLSRRVSQDGASITYDDVIDGTGEEIAPDRIPAVRAQVAQAQARLLTIAAPTDYPSIVPVVQAATKNGALKPIDAVFSQAIARDPTEMSGYQSRAAFRAGVFDRKGAIADWGQVIATEPTVDAYLARSRLYRSTGQDDAALADLTAAHTLDPSSSAALMQLAEAKSQRGDATGGLALIDAAVESAGSDRTDYLSSKAEIQTYVGDKAGAIATLDTAIAEKPGNALLLNARCWNKALLDTALDTALKDCTKGIELAEDPYYILDSRAMVYYRMNRWDDALADLDAALAGNPDAAGSLYLRGLVYGRKGDKDASTRDIALAGFIDPQVAKRYAHFGIQP